MSSDPALMLMMGEIRGELKGIRDSQTRQDEKLDTIDGRLRKVEIKAALNGAVTGSISGGIVGLGIFLIKESAKNIVNGNGA